MKAATGSSVGGKLSVLRRLSLLGVRPAAPSWAFVGLLALVLYRVPFGLANDYQLRVATMLVIYAIFTAGLEFVMGRAGQVSLGHGGFFAVGAYCEGVLQTQHGISAWPALLIAVVIGGLLGLVVGLPALRVKGPYLAVVTIGFALTVQALLMVVPRWTNGASGIAGTAYLPSIGLGGGALGSYYGAVLILVICLIGLTLLSWGRVGLTLNAICDSVTLARASGVSVATTKLCMFAVSAAVASASGAVFGTLGFISPDTFSLQLSIFPVVALVLGGLGTLAGPVIGAFALYGFDQVTSKTPQGSALMYGVLLMVVPLLLPKGIAGLLSGFWRRLVPTTWPPGLAVSRVPRDAPVAEARLEGTSLEVRGLSRHFGSVRAVEDVSISVAPGEVVGLVGPNGSGKSTLLNMMSGYYTPTVGQVFVDGEDITSLPLHRRVRRGVLPAFQTAQLMDTRSVRENLAVGALGSSRWGRGASREELESVLRQLDESLPLGAAAGTLPEGTRKIVELGRTLMARPRLLLLDEPTSGLSLQEVERVVAIIASVRQLGVTILLADHNFEFLGRVCDRLIVLEGGRLLAEGSAEELRQDERVVTAYLGTGMTKGGRHVTGTRAE